MKKVKNTPTNYIALFTAQRALLALLFAAITHVSAWAQCQPDITAPVCVAPPDITISCEVFDSTLLAYGAATISDNCALDSTKMYAGVYGLTQTVSYNNFSTLCKEGTLLRRFVAYDQSGNTSFCIHKIEVTHTQAYYIRFPNDVYLTGNVFTPPATGQPEILSEGCEAIATSYSDLVFPTGSGFNIERTWSIINWCTYDPNLPLLDIPNPTPNSVPNHASNLPGPIVSPGGAGVPSNWQPTVVKVLFSDPAPTNYSTFYNAAANGYRYVQYLFVDDTITSGVEGYIYFDENENCALESGESVTGDWKIKAIGNSSGLIWHASTTPDGHYTFKIPVSEGGATIMLDIPVNYSGPCPAAYTVQLLPDTLVTQHFAVHLEDTCKLLSVDIAAPFLRRCFNNTYTVQACNLGSEAVDSAHVVVHLDSYMSYVGSSILGESLGGNAYDFPLGTLDAGECVFFSIVTNISCSTPLGATHCTTAEIFPFDRCPEYENWNGAQVRASGYCDGDSVRIELKNIGNANMSETLDFIVVEDIIMMYNLSGTYHLDAGETYNIALPANGSTWRIEAEQEPTFPWNSLVSATVEGCGGLNVPGLVTAFSVSSANPYESTDCHENIGSYDPNDKQAVPKGIGESHLLRANTDIDYLIRFQNTGTDTAFTVVIRDTIAPVLDIASVRPGVGSHPYSFAVLEGNILEFRFDNIHLPDSNINEVASHGFIKFSIAQMPDLPDGTLINNNAAIYFDFNEPVITNIAFHTIGEIFTAVSTHPGPASTPLKIYPNPGYDMIHFEISGKPISGLFELTNSLGQKVLSEKINSQRYTLHRHHLIPGTYYFTILSSDGEMYQGKVVLKN